MHKALLFSIALLFSGIGSFVSAQIQGNYPIYGIIRSNSNPQSFQFGKVNSTTGFGAPIANTDLPANVSLSGLATIDYDQDRYYYLGINEIYTIDLNSGALLQTAPLIKPNTGYFGMIQYYHGDSTIYGLIHENAQPKWCAIDPASGVVTILNNTSLGNNTLLNGMGTIDQTNGIYYFLLLDDILVGVDIATGNVVSSVDVDPNNNHMIHSLQYSCSTNELFGMVSYGGTSYLASINPYSGYVNQLSTAPLNDQQFNGLVTIDDVTNTYYYTDINDRLKGVSLSTGALVSDVPMNLTIGSAFNLMVFKPITCNLSGSQSIPTTSPANPAPEKTNVFPVPANEQLTVQVSDPDNTPYVLYSITGEQVKSGRLNAAVTNIEVSDLPSGMYLLHLQEEVIKVVIEH